MENLYRPKDNPPRDRLILVYGTPEPHPNLMVEYLGPSWYTAYYDSIDDAYSINGGDFYGPFIKPLKWMKIPND